MRHILHFLQHERHEALVAAHEGLGVCGGGHGGPALSVLGGRVRGGVLCGGWDGDLGGFTLDVGVVAVARVSDWVSVREGRDGGELLVAAAEDCGANG